MLNIHWKDWCWSWNSILWPPDAKSWVMGKDLDAGKDWRWEEKGTTEDEMVEWHHRIDGHGFGWTLGVDDGQEDQACCGSWDRKESDTTEQLNWTLMSPVKRQSDITLILPPSFYKCCVVIYFAHSIKQKRIKQGFISAYSFWGCCFPLLYSILSLHINYFENMILIAAY